MAHAKWYGARESREQVETRALCWWVWLTCTSASEEATSDDARVWLGLPLPMPNQTRGRGAELEAAACVVGALPVFWYSIYLSGRLLDPFAEPQVTLGCRAGDWGPGVCGGACFKQRKTE